MLSLLASVIGTVAACAAGYLLRWSHELRARAEIYRRIATMLESAAEHATEHEQRREAAPWN